MNDWEEMRRRAGERLREGQWQAIDPIIGEMMSKLDWQKGLANDVPVGLRHDTEARCPEQCAEFRRIIERMYQLHLDKNADYSPMNILATGLVGLTTRIWDKTARLMNLMGFNIRTGEHSEPKEPKNESVEDTLLDLANYAVIALIFRAGKWGK